MVRQLDLVQVRSKAFCTVNLLECDRFLDIVWSAILLIYEALITNITDLMSIGCLHRGNPRRLGRSASGRDLLICFEAVSWSLIAALLLFAMGPLNRRQSFLPFGIRKFEGAAFAWVADNDLGIVIPVDAEQALQVAIVGMLSCEIQKCL